METCEGIPTKSSMHSRSKIIANFCVTQSSNWNSLIITGTINQNDGVCGGGMRAGYEKGLIW